MKESDLPPEPFDGFPGPEDQVRRWSLWCAKGATIRFSGLKDSIEIWSFHMAVEELLHNYDEAIGFFLAAFPPDSDARAAALRPAPSKDTDA